MYRYIKWMLEGAVQRLKEAHPAMFSDSARCKMPNVNLDNLREELFSSEVGLCRLNQVDP